MKPGPDRGHVVVLLGAESTGKTDLAEGLCQRLVGEGWRAAWVPELLRAWCAERGRTPRQDEQAAIRAAQDAAIAAAAATHDVVVADTSGLMTALYSRYVFADDGLMADAVAVHRAKVDQTLVTALDLPWVPDGIQRDSPEAQRRVDALLRTALAQADIAYSVVHGAGPARTGAAWRALQPGLRGLAGRFGSGAPGAHGTAEAGVGVSKAGAWQTGSATPSQPGRGSEAEAEETSALRSASGRPALGAGGWRCLCCDDPPSERALRALRPR